MCGTNVFYIKIIVQKYVVRDKCANMLKEMSNFTQLAAVITRFALFIYVCSYVLMTIC